MGGRLEVIEKLLKIIQGKAVNRPDVVAAVYDAIREKMQDRAKEGKDVGMARQAKRVQP